jgi:hypothetical protein
MNNRWVLGCRPNPFGKHDVALIDEPVHVRVGGLANKVRQNIGCWGSVVDGIAVSPEIERSTVLDEPAEPIQTIDTRLLHCQSAARLVASSKLMLEAAVYPSPQEAASYSGAHSTGTRRPTVVPCRSARAARCQTSIR